MPAKFVDGSIMRHIMTMTSAAGIGLMGVFLVDLIDMLFLSMLDSDNIIAGVGFAASISFFTVSLSIGITISMAALVSQMIGQRNSSQARRYVVNISVLAFILTAVTSSIIWLFLTDIFKLLGASGETLDIGVSYSNILLLSLPIFAVGMAMSAAIRAVGDAKLSMYATLIGGAVNALLDPIFIFTLDMGVEGAAIASVISRVAVLFVAFWGVSHKNKLITRFNLADFITDLRAIFAIAGPAMLTNVVTPLGNAIVINAVAKFGGAYVAGFAIIGRIIPVAFALIFALSGAIAPIIGQNFGANKIARIKQTFSNALIFCVIYVAAVSAVLFVLQDPLIALFKLQGNAAELMRVFCSWIAISFIFNGAQFVANSSFNNLGKPYYATCFNVGKATLGTLPFVIIGGNLNGAAGVLMGQAAGGMLFGLVSVVVAYAHINRLETKFTVAASS